MSISADLKGPLPPRPGQGSLVAIGVLTGLFTASTTAAVVLAFLAFRPQPAPATDRSSPAQPTQPPTKTETPTPRPPEEPYAQKGTVKADMAGGVVYYPIPYASPPHVTLTAKSSRSYLLTKQDELGFTWTLNLTPKELKDAAEALAKNPNFKPEPDELTWEAKGMRGGAVTIYPSLFEQKGAIKTNLLPEGEVYFPFPYASPPNVVLEGVGLLSLSITATSTTGFSWKSTANISQDATWTGKGIKATAEQVAQQIKNAPNGALLKPVEQEGHFSIDKGQSGEVFFAKPFGSPPNVEIVNTNEVACIIITNTTATGFKWQDRWAPEKGHYTTTIVARWKARGTQTAPPPEKPEKPEK